MTKAFHILVSLMVALPLGAGGLCCCLLGEAPSHAGAADVAPPPTHSCCSPAGSSAAEPTAQGDPVHDCDCPERETALLAGAADQEPLLGSAIAHGELLPPESRELTDPAGVSTGSLRPDPSPKRPLFRTLSVLRC